MNILFAFSFRSLFVVLKAGDEREKLLGNLLPFVSVIFQPGSFCSHTVIFKRSKLSLSGKKMYTLLYTYENRSNSKIFC